MSHEDARALRAQLDAANQTNRILSERIEYAVRKLAAYEQKAILQPDADIVDPALKALSVLRGDRRASKQKDQP